jgi:hypothetical protein
MEVMVGYYVPTDGDASLCKALPCFFDGGEEAGV